MALTAGNPATSADIKDLKSKVKAEMKRRTYGTGSLNVSANIGDFSQSANAGQPIKLEHFNETVGLLNKIRSQGYATQTRNVTPIPALQTALTNVGTYAGCTRYASTHYCTGGNCQGLCGGTCTGDCHTTCTANCKDNCSGGCKGGCNTTCTGGCKTGCSTECKNTCKGKCATCLGCTNSCVGDCNSTCSGIDSMCSNCSAGCQAQCTSWCYGSGYNNP